MSRRGCRAMQEHIGVHKVEAEMRGQGRVEVLPERYGGRCILTVEVGNIADGFALLQQEGTPRQISVPGQGLLRPCNVARVVLAERAERHAGLMPVVHEWLKIAGMEYDAIDAACEIL